MIAVKIAEHMLDKKYNDTGVLYRMLKYKFDFGIPFKDYEKVETARLEKARSYPY